MTDKELKTKISELADKNFEEIRAIRRHLHKYPELSFKEYQTSDYICKKLEEWGVQHQAGIVKTGILAEIEGDKPGKTVAFRADMDALPIEELNDVSYKSANSGVMHACGHDVHSASLLGMIKILSELKSHLKGKVQFIFQPGEERIPGGANLMLREGLFKDSEPDMVVAMHVYPDMEAGKVGFREGQYMASSDEIFLEVRGKGGHAALPERLVDPVLISSQILIALQQLVSRHNKPGLPSVLSFGKVMARGSVNVIPDKVNIEGTFRTMDEEWRKKAHEKIYNIARGVAEGLGGAVDVEIRRGYPSLINDPDLTSNLRKFAIDYVGSEKVFELDLRMTAEDFSYFAGKYPSSMFRLGVAPPGEKGTALHSPKFNVDEEAMKTSTGLLSWFAVNLLENS